MSSVEKKILLVNVFNLGKYRAELMRINAPITIQKLMSNLPLKGRALKQEKRMIMPTDLQVRPERPKTNFNAGDLSIDPSSGNLSIHLEAGNTPTPENFLGSISDEIITKGMPLSSGVLIKELE